MPLAGEAKRAWALEYVRRPEVRTRQASQAQVRRNYISSALSMLKMEAGCADCGYNEDPVALDFDHVRGVKVSHIRGLISCASFERILAEVEKCEVRCANCHRVRTAERRAASFLW